MQKTTDLSIDYTLIPSNVPVICIPYVFENIGEKRIEGIFKDLDIGRVDRIDLVPTTNHAPNGSKVNRVFIHINWKIDEVTNKIRTKMLCGKEVKVLYDGTYYWRLSASRAKEVGPSTVKRVQKDTKPRIQLDDEDDVPIKEYRGPPRGATRAPRGATRAPRDATRGEEAPRDYRPKGEYMPRQVAPPMAPCLGVPMAPCLGVAMAPCLGDFPSMSLQHPEEFVKDRNYSWDEEEYQPTTPPTPPPKDTRPLADIDHQEKVQDMTYAGVDGTPPKVTKRKFVKKAAKDSVKVEEVEEVEEA
jgi:hypothetical protein